MDDFILKLKQDTAKLHSIAERAGLNKKIFDGSLTREQFSNYLISKLHVYSALENAILLNKNNPSVSKIYMPELERRGHILNDLKLILSELPKEFPILSTTQSYVYHLNKLAQSSPELLIAHSYTNYLAELAGGSMIKEILINKYGYKNSELSIFNFEGVSDFKSFQSKYHQLMNEIIQENHLEDAFIQESKLSYIFSTTVLIELVS